MTNTTFQTSIINHGKAKPNMQCDRKTMTRNDLFSSYFNAFTMCVVPLTVTKRNGGILTTKEIQNTNDIKPWDRFLERVRLEKGCMMSLSRSMDITFTRMMEVKDGSNRCKNVQTWVMCRPRVACSSLVTHRWKYWISERIYPPRRGEWSMYKHICSCACPYVSIVTMAMAEMILQGIPKQQMISCTG